MKKKNKTKNKRLKKIQRVKRIKKLHIYRLMQVYVDEIIQIIGSLKSG